MKYYGGKRVVIIDKMYIVWEGMVIFVAGSSHLEIYINLRVYNKGQREED